MTMSILGLICYLGRTLLGYNGSLTIISILSKAGENIGQMQRCILELQQTIHQFFISLAWIPMGRRGLFRKERCALLLPFFCCSDMKKHAAFVSEIQLR